jgi:hypothetical protein
VDAEDVHGGVTERRPCRRRRAPWAALPQNAASAGAVAPAQWSREFRPSQGRAPTLLSQEALRRVRARFLTGRERSFVGVRDDVPLVLEPTRSRWSGGLDEFLTENSSQIVELLYRYGALLLRGFEIETEESFRLAVERVDRFRVMPAYFMAETGRLPVAGETGVFHTNIHKKTGGGFAVGGLHSEN